MTPSPTPSIIPPGRYAVEADPWSDEFRIFDMQWLAPCALPNKHGSLQILKFPTYSAARDWLDLCEANGLSMADTTTRGICCLSPAQLRAEACAGCGAALTATDRGGFPLTATGENGERLVACWSCNVKVTTVTDGSPWMTEACRLIDGPAGG